MSEVDEIMDAMKGKPPSRGGPLTPVEAARWALHIQMNRDRRISSLVTVEENIWVDVLLTRTPRPGDETYITVIERCYGMRPYVLSAQGTPMWLDNWLTEVLRPVHTRGNGLLEVPEGR